MPTMVPRIAQTSTAVGGKTSIIPGLVAVKTKGFDGPSPPLHAPSDSNNDNKNNIKTGKAKAKHQHQHGEMKRQRSLELLSTLLRDDDMHDVPRAAARDGLSLRRPRPQAPSFAATPRRISSTSSTATEDPSDDEEEEVFDTAARDMRRSRAEPGSDDGGAPASAFQRQLEEELLEMQGELRRQQQRQEQQRHQQQQKQQHRSSQTQQQQPPPPSFKKTQPSPPKAQGGRARRRSSHMDSPLDDPWDDSRESKLLRKHQCAHNQKPSQPPPAKHQAQQPYCRSKSNDAVFSISEHDDSLSPSVPSFVNYHDYHMARQGGSVSSHPSSQTSSQASHSRTSLQASRNPRPLSKSLHSESKPTISSQSPKEGKKGNAKNEAMHKGNRRRLSPHPVRGLVDPSLVKLAKKQPNKKNISSHHHNATQPNPPSSSSEQSSTSKLSMGPSLHSLAMSSQNNSGHDNFGPTKKPNSDTSLQKSVNSEGTVATIDPDPFEEAANYTTNCAAHGVHTAEELNHLIKAMQVEFQKLRSAKVDAVMRVSALETRLVVTQQERDAEYVQLREEMENWKQSSQKERVRCEGLTESMRGEVERWRDKNARLTIKWSEAMEANEELEDRIENLEEENWRLKKMLLKQKSHRADQCSDKDGVEADGRKGHRSVRSRDYKDCYAALKDARSQDRKGKGERSDSYGDLSVTGSREGSIISFLSATATMTTESTSSKIGSPASYHHRCRSPELAAACSSQHSSLYKQVSSPRHVHGAPQQASRHPQSVHVRHRQEGDASEGPPPPNSLPQAPSSWHGGNKKKSCIKRMPEIAPPLIREAPPPPPPLTGGGAAVPPPPRSKLFSSARDGCAGLRRKSSQGSVSALRDSAVSVPMAEREGDDIMSGLRSSSRSLDGMVVLMECLMREEEGFVGVDGSARSGPW